MPKTKHLMIVGLLLAVTAAVGARSMLRPGPPPPPAGQQHGGRVEAEVVTLTPFGFEPRQITRRAGPFFVVLHNQSGVPDVTLRLSRARGEGLHEVRLRPGKRRWEQRLALGPGEYVLTEAAHPEWALQLTVQARP